MEFYDHENKTALLNSPAAPLLENPPLPRTMELSTVEILTYYLFYKRRPGTSGYGNNNEIRSKYLNALVELDGLADFTGQSLRAASAEGLSTGTIERLGEAIGLAVVSQLHQLTEGDWAKIQETSKRKTLDYEWAASDGRTLIKIETKGSVCTNNSLKTSSVSKHKASIEAKKMAEREDQPSPSVPAMLYGTISVLDDRDGSIAKCWLLDPPFVLDTPPKDFRVLARLTALSDLISFISPRSQLAASLRTRMAALSGVERIDDLDGVPLLKGNGKGFSTQSYGWERHHNPWFVGKSVVADGPAGGQVFQLDKNVVLFIGIREEFLILGIQQSFDAISEYKKIAGTVFKRVQCSVPIGRFTTEFHPSFSDSVNISKSGGYVRFDLEGHLYYTSGGLVFGILPVPEATFDRAVGNGPPAGQVGL